MYRKYLSQAKQNAIFVPSRPKRSSRPQVVLMLLLLLLLIELNLLHASPDASSRRQADRHTPQ
jgi:hypothetical protein